MSFLNRFLPEQPQDDILASVVRNLEHLLNSRREYGSLLCNFGLADYLGEKGGNNTMLTVLREITDTILIYEPRLRVLSLKSVGRDEALRERIELEGMLLLPYWARSCQLLLLLHPITGAIEIPLALAATPDLPPASLSMIRPQRPVPLNVLSAASLAAQVGTGALLAAHPELTPLLVVAALAALDGLLLPELAGPAVEAGQAALEFHPELAAGLAVIGQAALAGLLPPRLAGRAAQAAKLAADSNAEVAEAVTRASVAARTGLVPPESDEEVRRPAKGREATEMVLLAALVAESGLLPPSVAAAVAQSPRLALTNLPELASALAVASLAAQLGGPSPQAFPPEDWDGP